MSKYSDSPTWADITPLPLDEGPSPHPLAAIAYAEDYLETMSYLRAVMAANEHTPRVLDLTEDLIDMNPAHYTVWLYRAKTILLLAEQDEGGAKRMLEKELEWLNETALAHQKNYQIWHHRNMVVNALAGMVEEKEEEEEEEGKLVEGEQAFMVKMFEKDAKNYHVWSYRQWMVRRFGLWGEKGKGELEFVEGLIEEDVRNNSAWNHRWFVVNGAPEGWGGVGEEMGVRERELEFVKRAVEKAPKNASAWNYLRGIVKVVGWDGVKGLREWVEGYARLDGDEDAIRSSQALDFLVDLLVAEKEKAKAAKALDLLSEKYDPIRKNYWAYRMTLLEVENKA